MRTPAEVTQFFRPQLTTLHDPFLMNDMDKAVNRLNKAMGAKERIMIYGDYDVDGTTAVALVFRTIIQTLNITSRPATTKVTVFHSRASTTPLKTT